MLSYWEQKTWFSNIDFTIVGSGIVGLNCAIAIKEKQPNAKVLILEKGPLPQGASTKNAGFACFGSLSELISDLKTHTEQEATQLLQDRINGLKALRNLLGDSTIDFQQNGGYELFLPHQKELYNNCLLELKLINTLFKPIFKKNLFEVKPTESFGNVLPKTIFNPFEGQIDTGKMMLALTQKAQEKGIIILNGQNVSGFNTQTNFVEITSNNFTFKTKKLCVATNGFGHELLGEKVTPARAQVLITKPIENLKVKGTFHLDEGFYYFRNIDNRILLGGGRNLDFKTENTTDLELNNLIQNKLDELLQNVILPNQTVEIEHRWTGIMGVGTKKTPIIKALNDKVFCGVRLGGMGIAIGTHVGRALAKIAMQ